MMWNFMMRLQAEQGNIGKLVCHRVLPQLGQCFPLLIWSCLPLAAIKAVPNGFSLRCIMQVALSQRHFQFCTTSSRQIKVIYVQVEPTSAFFFPKVDEKRRDMGEIIICRLVLLHITPLQFLFLATGLCSWGACVLSNLFLCLKYCRHEIERCRWGQTVWPEIFCIWSPKLLWAIALCQWVYAN